MSAALSAFLCAATALLLTPQPPAQLHRPTSRPRAHPPRAGVPGFSTWLRKEFGDAYCGVPDKYAADVLCFDMNSIVHTQLRRSKNESHAFVRIFRQLHATMRVVRPRQHVLLALDGPAPLAKMATQRERRRKSADRLTEKGLSPLYATPGTIFMQRLEEALVYFCCEQLCTQRGSGLTFHVSGAETPGEGEFKLLEWLLAQDPPRGGKRPPSAVIVGGDGDLVLQALTLQQVPSLFVVRELASRKKASRPPPGPLPAAVPCRTCTSGAPPIPTPLSVCRSPPLAAPRPLPARRRASASTCPRCAGASPRRAACARRRAARSTIWRRWRASR